MRSLVPLVVSLLYGGLLSAQEPPPQSPSDALLDQALALAKSVPDRAERADAVARVAAEVARTEPKRALEVLKGELGTHAVSSATAAAAQRLAQSNRLLGLATLLRIHDMSTVMVALSKIVAMEALTHFDDALDVVVNVEPLTVRRMVEREVTRVIWAEIPGDRAAAVDVAVRWAQTVDDPLTRDEALALAAEGAATVDLARAQEIALSISEAESQDLALRLVIQQLAAVDVDAAQRLLGRVRSPLQHNLAGAAVVSALMAAGRAPESLELAGSVRTSAANDLESLLEQSLVREQLALAMVSADAAGALSVASEVWPPADRYTVESRLARTIGRTDAARAEELLSDAVVEIGRIDSPLAQRRLAAAAVASAAVVAPGVIDALAQDHPGLLQAALPDAVLQLAAEDPDAGLGLTERIEDAKLAQETRARVVEVVATSHPETAQRVADGLALPGPRSAALVSLVVAARNG